MRKVKLNEVTMLKNLFSGFKSHYKEIMYRTMLESIKSGSLELIKEGKSTEFLSKGIRIRRYSGSGHIRTVC